MPDRSRDVRVARQDAGEGASGATAWFPYDRTTVERFREAFPRARWRDDLQAWFVPGIRAERRVTAWMGRAWSGMLAHADQRGRDAFDFDPIASPYLQVADGFVVRTPYARSVVAELREVPWASWDPALRSAASAFRFPFSGEAFSSSARRRRRSGSARRAGRGARHPHRDPRCGSRDRPCRA